MFTARFYSTCGIRRGCTAGIVLLVLLVSWHTELSILHVVNMEISRLSKLVDAVLFEVTASATANLKGIT
ncbi:hypothetical protein SERLA73DRAFT_178513 [Serpula lacrymans var. lacrymans S7.3]|uniref:Uncharacterized protein n=2 Tax=Serpula lacrymans var. lacrymans TaxID=341189 RepID=F8PRS4_SERL3|nr:uncharacterized protein SERLADRAFT_462998 [Serpula lacrymans var. lacrymans S7.9]EGO00644.1 hypothetical protein SERLA73DRAFT_178513 [Serpula lacrymans var. lacrymans S7.3]EGO26199.1 hypothetical protein SERLADRAFT_462998 [Serpula lacrymans var. lacrymans S7.9]